MERHQDRVKETTTTTGTGDITLAGAVSQFVSFSSRYSSGASAEAADRFFYAIVGQTGTEWEVGYGYLSGASTLVRNEVYASSNADALVNFGAGIKDVFISITAKRINRTGTQGQISAIASGQALP